MKRRIVYLSWPPREIAGGIKMVYRHVEALESAGMPATVATADCLPPEWFDTTAQTIGLDSLEPNSDVLVFPENHNGLLQRFRDWPNLKVVFCQNPYMAFRGLGGSRCYSDFGVRRILTVGRHASNLCRQRFHGLALDVIPVFVDGDLFRFSNEKHLQIAYSPRKRPLEAEFVKDLFRARNQQWKDIRWIGIVGKSESEVAAILSRSTHYLSLCRFEACPLSVLEAFSCGCIVSGFTGFGGRDYTTVSNGFWANEDDCVDVVSQLTQAVQLVVDGGRLYTDMIAESRTTAARYSRAQFEQHLVRYWSELLSSAP